MIFVTDYMNVYKFYVLIAMKKKIFLIFICSIQYPSLLLVLGRAKQYNIFKFVELANKCIILDDSLNILYAFKKAAIRF